MRATSCAILSLCLAGAWLLGCDDSAEEPAPDTAADGGPSGSDGGPTPGPSSGPANGGLEIDTSPTETFVVGYPASHPVSGHVTAPLGLAAFTIGGEPGSVADGGDFSQPVAVAPGLTLLEIRATDSATPSNQRCGDLSLLAAGYRPEGTLNAAAVAIALTPELLEAVAAEARAALAEVDLAAELMAAGPISSSGCEMTVTDVTHDPPDVALAIDEAGALDVEVLIPSMHITFDGTCRILVPMDVSGAIDMDFFLATTMSAPRSESCIDGFEHTPPEVELRGFDLTLEAGGPLGPIVGAIAGMFEGRVATEIEAQVEEQADALLEEELSDLAVFEMSQVVDLMGAEATVEGCLTGLETAGGLTRAIIGMSVDSGSAVEAPGAPFLDGALPESPPGTLLLDAGFVGQLMYSAWAAGLLDQPDVEEIDIGLVSLLAPELEDRFPGATTVSISIDGRLPPLVTAAPAEAGDMVVEIGNLEVLLAIEGELVYRIRTHIRATVELEPEGAAVRPAVSAVESAVCVLEEPVVDIDDAALEEAVDMTIADMANELLGDAAIALPDTGLGTTFTILDVSPLPGTGYLRIDFE